MTQYALDYLFSFNLQTKEVFEGRTKEISDEEERDRVRWLCDYAVTYYNTTEGGMMAEVGDGLRHQVGIQAKHWNRLLKIIRDEELDNSGIEMLTRGFLARGLPEEYESTFISAVKEGVIKEIELSSKE